MSYVIGIDIGSSHSKGVIINNNEIITKYDCPSSGDLKVIGQNVLDQLLKISNLNADDIASIFVTGYGSKQVGFATDTRSDIACHGKGTHFHFPSV